MTEKKLIDPGIYSKPTEEDYLLARRRFEAYNRISAEHPNKPWKEILLLLPLDGGTKLKCGCTRFDHLTFSSCPKGEFLDRYGDLK